MSHQPPSGADNYKLGDEIARGGMGSVLQAEDGKLKRTVALKAMLMDGDANRGLRQRFIREAEVLAMLAHPNIVPIYDIVWEDGVPLFYTMKLVKGRTLQAIINDLRAGNPETLREFTLDRLLGIFRNISNAIAFAHSKGVLHRDLKPENVMVGEFGEVLVMDWGLAKIQNAEMRGQGDAEGGESLLPAVYHSQATVVGAVIGTPEYMSPEQALGHIDELDERSDIFSLGGILYAILTLRPPVEGKTLNEVLAKVSGGQIAPPSSLNAGPTQKGAPLPAGKIKPLPHIAGGRVPAALSAVAMKALSLAKENRYQRVMDFGADIEAYQGGYATGAEQAGAVKQLGLLMRRHKGVTAALAAIVLLSIGFVVKLIASEHRAVTNESAALQQKEAARRALAESSKSLAEAWLRESNGPAMETVLEKVPDDLRDGLWHYLHSESDSSIARFPHNIQDIAAHAKLPSVFAIATDRLRVMLVSVKTGAQLLDFAPGFANLDGTTYLRLSVSPDGEFIAIGRDGPGGIVIHSAKDGAKVREWEAPNSTKLEFNADSTRLMQTVGVITERADADDGRRNNAVEVWNPANGALLWSFRRPFWVHGFFTPDGRNALIEAWNEYLRLVDATTGKLVRQMEVGDVSVSVSTAPDGESAVSGQRFGYFQSINLADGTSRFRNRIHNQVVYFVGYVPNGGQFVTIATLLDGRRDIRIWNAENGTLVRALLGGRGWEHSAAIHPLSGELFVGGADNRAWNLSGPPPKWILPGTITALVEFWGHDDTLFAPNDDANSWMDISQSPPAPLWQTRAGGYGTVFSSAGDIAVVGIPYGKDPVNLVRRNGRQVKTLTTFKPVAEVEVGGAKLSPRGDSVAIREKGPVEIFSVAKPEQKGKPADVSEFKSVRDIAWVLDGAKLLGIAEGKDSDLIVAWDPATGSRLVALPLNAPSAVIAVAPDGKQFAEAGTDKNIRIRDATTLQVIKEFRASNTPITAIAWHPHRPIIAIGSEDQSVKLWDFAAEKKLDAFYQMNSYPMGLSFSPSGKRLAAAQIKGALVWEPESLSGTTPPEFIPQTIPKRPVPIVDANRFTDLVVDADGFTDILAPLTSAEGKKTRRRWRLKDGELASPNATGHATLPLPAEVSGTSYTVRVKLRQLPAEDCFHVILPVADRMCGFDLEGRSLIGIHTSLIQVDGKYGKDLPGSVSGKLVNDTEPHDLAITVRLDGANATIIATLDTRPIYEWTGPTAALSQHPTWASTEPGSLALGTYAGGWVVSEVKLKRLE